VEQLGRYRISGDEVNYLSLAENVKFISQQELLTIPLLGAVQDDRT